MFLKELYSVTSVAALVFWNKFCLHIKIFKEFKIQIQDFQQYFEIFEKVQ